ncbi:MAG: hypothetical protein IT222_03140, partial [Crocinitomix sp.]|nr:hypothetical protein [Crocinitomix sp.]
FVLSQEGKVGRLAIEQMSLKYSQIHYPSPLIVKIIEIVRSIEWDVAENEGIPVDCQLFLIFKIEKGKLIDVYV